MTSALLFDLDGTLSDSHALARATWLEVLRPHGVDVDFQVYQDRIRGRRHDEVVRDLLPELPQADRQRLLESQAISYRERTQGAGPIPGLRTFLDGALQRGYRLALVSNTPRANAGSVLEPLGLETMFETAVFADEVEHSKPNPDVYRCALEQLAVEPDDALAFEDSPKGVTAAQRAGIPVIGLVTTHRPAELREVGAALVVADFADAALYEVLDRPESVRR